MKSKFRQLLNYFDKHILISNLTLVIILGSATCFIFSSFDKGFTNSLSFSAQLFNQENTGEYSHFFYPIDTNPFFAFFAYYFYYFMGTALEQEWGAGKYTRYIGLCALLCLGISFFYPHAILTNGFITYAIFWAFAFLYPEFQVYLFFIIPVKVKHIAWFSWGLSAISLFLADISQKVEIIASMACFALFFGPQIIAKITGKFPAVTTETMIIKIQPSAFHQCHQCQANEQLFPDLDFRVCSTCKHEFCANHLGTHPHP